MSVTGTYGQSAVGRSAGIPVARLRFILSILYVRLALDVVYYLYMNPVFGTHFLTPMPINFSIVQYTVSICLALAPGFFVPFSNRNFSGIFFLVAVMFTYLPITSMYGFDYQKSPALISYALLALIVSYLVSELKFRETRIPVIAGGEKLAMGISVAFVGLFVVNAFASGAVALINFNINRVYEFRSGAGELLDVGILAYTNLWAQKVFNPLLFCIALYRRNIPLMVATIGMQVFFFGITHHRVHLFVPLMIYLISLIYSRNIQIQKFYYLVAGLLVGFLGLALVLDLETLMALFLRRAFFVPASVSFDWMDYFIDHPKVYWADKLLAAGTDTIYTSTSIVRMMGNYMAPGKELNFNTGIVAAGYAQAGILGVIFYATIFGAFLKVLNALIRSGIPAYFCAGILVQPFNDGWSSADLFSTLLSHGIIVGTVMLWIIGKPKQSPAAIRGRGKRSAKGFFRIRSRWR